MDIRVADDAEGAAALAARWIARRATDAVRRRGAFTLAVSGGSGPNEMFDVLATLDVPWERTTILQVDERIAPDGSPDRNATQLAAHLGNAARKAKVQLMPVTATDVRRSAGRYAARVAAATPIDVVHLGMGDDGHTASWPPGDPVGDLKGPDAPAVTVVGPFNGLRRMTLTPPVVNAARARLMYVTGAGKAEMIERWLLRDPALPVERLHRRNTVVVLDRAAASRLPTG
jgi:6-phosphogluconolactonase